MNIKSIAIASAFALAGVSASATTYDAGVNPVAYEKTVSGLALNTRFYDTYTFSISPGGDVVGSGSYTSQLTSRGSVVVFDIKDFTVSLFKETGREDLLIGSVSGTNTVTLNSWEFTPGNAVLAGGDYYFVVTGTTAGSATGSYNFRVDVTAAPVPEPETYALMLAGLGGLAFVARRRKSV